MLNLISVGVDNGYDQVKITAQKDGEIVEKIIPSVAVRSEDVGTFGELANLNYKEDEMLVKYEGTDYLLGELAIDQDSRAGSQNFKEDKYKDVEEKVKFLGIISLLYDEDSINIENLVVGLPISIQKEHKKRFVQEFKNKTFPFSIPDGNGNFINKKITVQNVICVPQGIAAYYDMIFGWDGKPNNPDLLSRRYGMIDVGGKTTEAFIADGKKPIFGTDESFNAGATKVFDEVSKDFNEAPETLIEMVFLGKKKNEVWDGMDLNRESIKMKCRPKFKSLAEGIYSQLIRRWEDNMKRLSFILLCGGTAAFTEEYFKDLFDLKVKSVDEAQLTNSRGYYKIGVYKSKKDQETE